MAKQSTKSLVIEFMDRFFVNKGKASKFFDVEDVREIIALRLTDDNETEMICSAIYHHDDKLVTDSPMDEILKDADVIHHVMNDLSKEIKEKEQARYDKLCEEFGM